MDIIIVTGMSGAGKSSAYDCFEDLGYYCIDNLPPALIKSVLELLGQGKRDVEQAVFVIDMRGGEFFNDLKNVLADISASGFACKILFLDASDDILLRRFNETRRSHPLAGRSNLEGIAQERSCLLEMKRISDFVIDTSNMKTAALKEEIRRIFLQNADKTFEISILSFGFKYGLPVEADMVFDVRFIPNPFYVPELKELTGKSKEVSDYVMDQAISRDFKNNALKLIEALIPGFAKEGKYKLNIAFGCTGGRHRSVSLAEAVYKALGEAGFEVSLAHRDIGGI
ncbi:MAG: RNase adapter RapZ [Clostridiales Family XIII bacterium]|jgi:UPF0042 nucleotide-binding protein|nr:RNase adapter RapZ [Clostridiales Family XIII bacterium]